VPQAVPTTFPFTALEVVQTGRSPYTKGYQFENPDDRDLARQALDTVGALHLETRRMTELSGGERQLVSVARALAQEPTCLLLDEPASSLDLKHRASLVRLLADLRGRDRLTSLVVTHDLALLDPLFDYVFGMRCGAVAAEGTPAEVLRDEVLAALFDDPNVRARRIEGRTFVWSDS
jgi:ABC-type cobalamin/Fe3+-siderophores transport system ATPase subunit